MKRRALITLAAAAAASAVVPVSLAAVRPAAEHPNAKVRRLSREIADALNDAEFIGFRHVTITPNGVLYEEAAVDFTPGQRLRAAVAEVRNSMEAKYPGWRVQVENRALGFINERTGKQEGPPRRHGILLYASDERYGPEKPHWFVDYGA